MNKIYTYLKVINWRKWVRNTVLFIRPLFVLYAGYVGLQITEAQGAFNLSFLVPNSFVVGAGVLYIFNTVQDLLFKIDEGRKTVK